MKTRLEIEDSVLVTFQQTIYRKFLNVIKDYSLIEKGDHILVCISGGKDSLLMAFCFELLKRHKNISFTYTMVCIDPGYSKKNVSMLTENVKKLGLDVHFFQEEILSCVENLKKVSPCYVCSQKRRAVLYRIAEQFGCNKIALGHHRNDVNETLLLSMFYSGEIKGMLPKVISGKGNITVIRPLYYIDEQDIILWQKQNKITCLTCGCSKAKGKNASKRSEVKHMIANLKKCNSNIEHNIFQSMSHFHLDSMLKVSSNKEK